MIDQLAKELFAKLSSTLNEGQARQDFSASQIKALIESALRKCNLVTREEFDAQAAVLARTREKLEALEKSLAEWESKAREK